jgi:hypothetical protein
MSTGRRILVTALTALLSTAVVAPSQGVQATYLKCKGTGEGYEKIHGRPTYTFCGPATAEAVIAGKAYAFKGGLCRYDKKNDYWLLHIGKAETGQAPPTLKYLGITIFHPGSPKVPAPDGVPFPGQASVSFDVPGLRGGVSGAIVTFGNGGRTGEFRGQTFDKQPVNGTFRCK